MPSAAGARCRWRRTGRRSSWRRPCARSTSRCWTAERRELQRMTSAVQVMPGERVSCIGCHESRQSAPPAGAPMPLAARKPPRDLEAARGLPGRHRRFPDGRPARAGQVLRHAATRGPRRPAAATSAATRRATSTWPTTTCSAAAAPIASTTWTRGEMLPAERAKGKPLVHFFWLLRTPTAVNQPLWTGCYASRLPDYLDDRALRAGDAARPIGSGSTCGSTPTCPTTAPTPTAGPTRPASATCGPTRRRASWPHGSPTIFCGVYDRRCAECHGRLEGTTGLGRPLRLDRSQPARAEPGPFGPLEQASRRAWDRQAIARQDAAAICRCGGPGLRCHAHGHSGRSGDGPANAGGRYAGISRTNGQPLSFTVEKPWTSSCPRPGHQRQQGDALHADGRLVASRTCAYQTHFFNGNWAEQNPDDWWRAICSRHAGAAGGDRSGPDRRRGAERPDDGLHARGQAGQLPCGRSILYCDQRAGRQADRFSQRIGLSEFYGSSGIASAPRTRWKN